jgi:hypothetical protein
MKAIINNGTTYKVTGEKGAFTITEDVKGKVKMFQTSTIEIIDAEFGKVKVYAKAKQPVSAAAKRNATAYIAEMKKDLNDAKYSTGRYTNQ